MSTTDIEVDVEAAYQACEQITRTEARNFNYGIKLLPEPKRRAMSALYALARRIDDIGDGDLPPAEKLAGLAHVRKDVAALGDVVDRTDAVMVAVADTCRRYPIPTSALDELIDGCELDVLGTSYETFDDLVRYCRRVAGTVGRLSLAVYGCNDLGRATPLADDLGVALQITNILRDIIEDYRDMGRVYLPAADRARFGVPSDLSGPPDHLVALIAFEATRVEEWYERGLGLLPMLDWRSRACTAAMAGIYRRLLLTIQRDPAAVLQRRLSLPAWQKAGVAARAPGAGPSVTDPPHVVVVGGGLAGLSAALASADGGARVTLFERRQRLGGLTWSFAHHGLSVDNGQHVFLRCCREYLSFLVRIGARDDVVVQERLDIPVVAPAAGHVPPTVGRLRRSSLPAPLQLAGSLLRYPHLPVAQRLRLGRVLRALQQLRLDDPALDDVTFGEWLRAHGQSDAAVATVWDLITVPTLNLPAAEASLALAAMVFKTGLLEDATAADIGWSRVPLGVLHGERSSLALSQADVDVRLGARIQAVRPDARGGFVVDGLHADAVVVALPHEEAAQVLPADAIAHQSRLAELGASSIVDVHLVYDRAVTTWPLMAAVHSPVQWVFDRTASAGLDTGQYLAVSISASDDLLAERPEVLAGRVGTEVARLLPAAGGARIVDSLVTKERRATFRAVPGTAALRPVARTSMPGLTVAGAWTNTGWPATMEGAVQSGRAAARDALGALRRIPQTKEVA